MTQQASGGFYRLTDIVRTPTNRGKPTRLPISRTKWYEGVNAGIFPKPIKFGGISVWPKEVIHDLERRIIAGELSEDCAA